MPIPWIPLTVWYVAVLLLVPALAARDMVRAREAVSPLFLIPVGMSLAPVLVGFYAWSGTHTFARFMPWIVGPFCGTAVVLVWYAGWLTMARWVRPGPRDADRPEFSDDLLAWGIGLGLYVLVAGLLLWGAFCAFSPLVSAALLMGIGLGRKGSVRVDNARRAVGGALILAVACFELALLTGFAWTVRDPFFFGTDGILLVLALFGLVYAAMVAAFARPRPLHILVPVGVLAAFPALCIVDAYDRIEAPLPRAIDLRGEPVVQGVSPTTNMPCHLFETRLDPIGSGPRFQGAFPVDLSMCSVYVHPDVPAPNVPPYGNLVLDGGWTQVWMYDLPPHLKPDEILWVRQDGDRARVNDSEPMSLDALHDALQERRPMDYNYSLVIETDPEDPWTIQTGLQVCFSAAHNEHLNCVYR